MTRLLGHFPLPLRLLAIIQINRFLYLVCGLTGHWESMIGCVHATATYEDCREMRETGYCWAGVGAGSDRFVGLYCTVHYYSIENIGTVHIGEPEPATAPADI